MILITDEYYLEKVLGKINEIISTEEFYDTKILIDTDHKLRYHITLKNGVILMTCIIKDHDQFYPKVFLKKVFVFK